MGLFPEITVAVVLLIIAGVAVLISQMGVLPKKSLPYVAAALAGVFGIATFKRWRDKSQRDELEKRRKALQALEETAAQAKARYQITDQKYSEVKAQLQQQEDAVQKGLLLSQAQGDKERKEIEGLQGDDLHRRFMEEASKP